MALLSTFPKTQFQKVLCYGPSGNGKTVFASTFPGKKKVWDFDRKIGSAANFWAARNPAVLEEIDVETFPGMDRAQMFTTYSSQLRALEAAGSNIPFDTVILDSATIWSECLMSTIIQQNPGVKGPISSSPDVPGLQHYQIFGVKFREQLGRLLALPAHVVVTGHVETVKDEHTGALAYKPLVAGKNADYFPIVFAEVYRAFAEATKAGDKEETAYFGQTKAGGGYIARSQISGLPGRIPLTYDSLTAKR